MIEAITGSASSEQVLIYISANKEAYAREISAFYGVSLSPIQNQLNKLELGGILMSRLAGKTRLYFFNPRYAFYKELAAFFKKVIEFLPDEEKQRMLNVRKRPRRKLKPLSVKRKANKLKM
jgi:predicted transcriptional regulator